MTQLMFALLLSFNTGYVIQDNNSPIYDEYLITNSVSEGFGPAYEDRLIKMIPTIRPIRWNCLVKKVFMADPKRKSDFCIH